MVATGKITKRAVDSIPVPAPGKREYLWDETLKGFGCMVTDKGARSYIVQYRLDGRGSPTRRVTIGKHGSPWTPDSARNRAAELLEQVRRKVDPFDAAKEILAAQRREREAQIAKEAALTKLLFSNIAPEYLASVSTLRSIATKRAVIENDLMEPFGAKTLPEIDADDINGTLRKLGTRAKSAPIKAYAELRCIFGYAHDTYPKLFPHSASPFFEVKRPAPGGTRSNYLKDDTLRLMWLAAADLGWPYGPVYQLLLLTGMRLREVADGRWSEIDVKEMSWLIPGERTKNKEPHWVPITDEVLEIIESLPRIANSDLMFSSRGVVPVSNWGRAKRRLDETMLKIARREAEELGADPDKVSIPTFRIHDTRRTLARGCQSMGVPPEVIERMLGHLTGTQSGLKGVYQIYQYETQRREAFAFWAQRVLAISRRNSDGTVDLWEPEVC